MNFFRNLIVALFLIFLILPSALSADEAPVSVVVAGDSSGSMYVLNAGPGASPRHIDVQTQAIISAVSMYVSACAELQFSYIAWGKKPKPPITFMLHDYASNSEFRTALWSVAAGNSLGGTMHRAAIDDAIAYAETQAAPQTVIIFITDEASKSDDFIVLDLPPQTQLIKISLGSQEASTYMSNAFMPEVGTHRHANTADELSAIIHEVFANLTDLCIG